MSVHLRRLQNSYGAVYMVNTTMQGSGPTKGKPMYGKVNLSYVDAYCGVVTHARLVCAAFHGPAPSAAHVVNHIDGNIKNVRSTVCMLKFFVAIVAIIVHTNMLYSPLS